MKAPPESCGYDASDGVTDNPDGGYPREVTAEERRVPQIKDDPKQTFSVSSRAVEFMRDQVAAKHPFYVQVSYYAAHVNVEVREATLRKYLNKGTPDRGYVEGWAAMLEDLDTGIGQVLEALENLKIADNTYVFLTADNGGSTEPVPKDVDRLPPNHPLRGSKHSLYEGGIRVPFIVRGPGIRTGSCCRVPVAGYDLLPTIYDLAGGKKPLPHEIDGGSFKHLLTGSGSGDVKRPLDALVFHRPGRKMSAIRRGNDKLVIHWTPQDTVESRELFDLGPDPFESNDLAKTQSVKADQLQATLLAYLKDVDAETPTRFGKLTLVPK